MKRKTTLVVLAAALGVAACTPDQPTSPELGAQFWTSVEFEKTRLCKVGSAADFEVVRTPVGGDPYTFYVHLEDGECQPIAEHNEANQFDLTVTEVSPAEGFALDRIEVYSADGIEVVTGTSTITRHVPPRLTIKYFNEPTGIGRMTGGGHQIRIDGVRVTRGLTIHCDIILSNNLEINWGGNSWHLDKPLTSAVCIDDPSVSPVPPPAPFDTFIGEGVGRLNGDDGSWVRFTFVDAGEPGRDDTAWIRIWAPGDDPDVDEPYLEVSGNLDGGNLQAHYDQPHS